MEVTEIDLNWSDPYSKLNNYFALKILIGAWIVFITIFGTINYVGIVAFELTSGDPKKRGILNQVSLKRVPVLKSQVQTTTASALNPNALHDNRLVLDCDSANLLATFDWSGWKRWHLLDLVFPARCFVPHSNTDRDPALDSEISFHRGLQRCPPNRRRVLCCVSDGFESCHWINTFLY